MTTQDFFNEQSEQSKIKSAIVSKYFDVWSNVIMNAQDKRSGYRNLAYIDLFSGPGRYHDGTPSTPVQILKKAVTDERLRNRLVTFFNDVDAGAAEALRGVIRQIPRIETLGIAPDVRNFEVGQEVAEWLGSRPMFPSLVFLDPWGYKGLSVDLVEAATKDWGSDTILFFNYNRVNMALNNPAVRERVAAIFGVEHVVELRRKVDGLSSRERELVVIEDLCRVLGQGGRHVLPFRFRDELGTRTSHYLFLVTKHPKGYDIMKGIMARESSKTEQGVASFEYNPLDFRDVKQFPLLAGLAPRPLDELAEMLLVKFAGRTLRMKDIYEVHNVGRPYVTSNYKKALLMLEEDGRVAASDHKKGTFADHVEVTFPAV